jgi:hypothetical protein
MDVAICLEIINPTSYIRHYEKYSIACRTSSSLPGALPMMMVLLQYCWIVLAVVLPMANKIVCSGILLLLKKLLTALGL